VRVPVATEPKVRFRLENGLRGEVSRTASDPERSFKVPGDSLRVGGGPFGQSEINRPEPASNPRCVRRSSHMSNACSRAGLLA
jgi:hypothetical protein